MAKKSTFFRNFQFFFRLGPVLGGLPVLGKILMHFEPGGQKSRKKSKKHEKVEFFKFFEIDPNVKIWSFGGQFWPKNQVFEAGAYTGGGLVLGKILMHFRLGVTNWSIFVR